MVDLCGFWDMLMFLWLFIVVVCLGGKMFLYLYYLYVKKIFENLWIFLCFIDNNFW